MMNIINSNCLIQCQLIKTVCIKNLIKYLVKSLTPHMPKNAVANFSSTILREINEKTKYIDRISIKTINFDVNY